MLSGRRKLLLADDSPTIQKVISLTFGDEGVEVVAVGDGERALRALAEEPPPDVVLADVVMPGPDGYELCERIKRDGRLRHVPVVLLVGTFEPFNEAEARRVGADTVLTKPFQSIRDLVSKVGSLLGGGGESKEDEPHAPRATQDVPHAEPPHADSAARLEAEAHAGESNDLSGEPPVADAAASFADLGADDELIEARPAEAFGAAAASYAPTRESAPATVSAREPDFHEPDFHVAPTPETNGNAAHAPDDSAAPVWDAEEFGGAVKETNNAGAFLTNRADERVMREQTFPQTSFDTSFDRRATASAAADDALLDLGQVDTSASVAVAEADDFVLDLDFGDETPAAHDAGFSSDSPLDEWQLDTPSRADAPSAFAEAAHGEQPRAFMEATPLEAAPSFDQQTSFDEPAQTFDEPDHSFVESAPSFESTSSSESPAHEETPWRDVVMQDGPQGFAFGGEPQPVASEPRGFVEPEVVSADEPVPAVVESEFTDGSVEGDVPKSPAAQSTSVDAAPQEPSTAGYAVGQARTGLEESPRADQLSPEAIEAIARRVVEMMSDKVVREIAWEVVPELAELLVKKRLEEEKRS